MFNASSQRQISCGLCGYSPFLSVLLLFLKKFLFSILAKLQNQKWTPIASSKQSHCCTSEQSKTLMCWIIFHNLLWKISGSGFNVGDQSRTSQFQSSDGTLVCSYAGIMTHKDAAATLLSMLCVLLGDCSVDCIVAVWQVWLTLSSNGEVRQEVKANDPGRPIAQPGGLLGHDQLVVLSIERWSWQALENFTHLFTLQSFLPFTGSEKWPGVILRW